MWILWPIGLCVVGIVHAVLPAGALADEPAAVAPAAAASSWRFGGAVRASALALFTVGVAVAVSVIVA
jgi:hypothetical protein